MGQYLQLLETVSKIKLLEERFFEELSIEDLIFLSENGRKYLTEGLEIPDIRYENISPETMEELKKNGLTPKNVEEIFREKISPNFKGKMFFGNIYYKGKHAEERTQDRHILNNIPEIAETLALFFRDYGKKLRQKSELAHFEIAIEDNIDGHKERLHPAIAYDTSGTNDQSKHAFRIMTIKPSPFRPNSHASRSDYVAGAASVPRKEKQERKVAPNGVEYFRDHLVIYP